MTFQSLRTARWPMDSDDDRVAIGRADWTMGNRSGAAANEIGDHP